jgi:hypothetical protein
MATGAFDDNVKARVEGAISQGVQKKVRHAEKSRLCICHAPPARQSNRSSINYIAVYPTTEYVARVH